jgi:hypothetical protein
MTITNNPVIYQSVNITFSFRTSIIHANPAGRTSHAHFASTEPPTESVTSRVSGHAKQGGQSNHTVTHGHECNLQYDSNNTALAPNAFEPCH